MLIDYKSGPACMVGVKAQYAQTVSIKMWCIQNRQKKKRKTKKNNNNNKKTCSKVNKARSTHIQNEKKQTFRSATKLAREKAIKRVKLDFYILFF